MRKIIWYEGKRNLETGEDIWKPIYGVGSWWAHLLYRWLEDLSSWLADVVHDIQVNYIKPEDDNEKPYSVEVEGIEKDGSVYGEIKLSNEIKKWKRVKILCCF